MDELQKDNFYVALRTRAIKEGDAQVGITYPHYLTVYGALVTMCQHTGEDPSLMAFRFTDVLAIIDGEIKHMTYDELDKVVDDLDCVSVSDVSALMLPFIASLPAEAISAYRVYQQMVKMINDGHHDAGTAGKTLNSWKTASHKLQEAAEELVGKAQLKLGLE